MPRAQWRGSSTPEEDGEQQEEEIRLDAESLPPVPVAAESDAHPTPRDRASLLILIWAAALLVAVAPFVTGLLGAAVLYVIFVRPNAWLARRFSSNVAASLTIIVSLMLVAAVLALLFVLAKDQAPDVLNRFRTGEVMAKIAQLQIGPVNVGAELAKASNDIGSWVSTRLFSFAGGATAVLLNFLIAFSGAYYMLTSDGAWAVARTYIPFSPRTADVLRERFVSVTQAMVAGTLLVAILQGTIVGLGFAVVGLPNPLFWGMVAVFAAMVPLIGTTLVWGPAVLVLLSRGETQSAIVLLVMGGGIAGNIDNVIRPIVYRRVGNLHPMITLIGAFVGVRFLGILGVLFGPLFIAYLFELLRVYREEYESAARVVAARPSVAELGTPAVTAPA